jgi:hypothetical protein
MITPKEKLSPQQADIFDECSEGMTLDGLCAIFYSGTPRGAAANCIKVQVHEINARLCLSPRVREIAQIEDGT